ncbi:hypothetical protein SG34_018460 [Thalassomonas viridans]|uniref:Bacterial surface antigen (D15) domain-containing protein n=1 Tax=Thalassomonas viridans TaxID=137584 RepID=A0AAF0C762_9GAMM|nr:hypothetical protein [Thalassomonas viridans]WDE03373.1 hypothetical protein SG34_018460 [Thalassomonas viridans]
MSAARVGCTCFYLSILLLLAPYYSLGAETATTPCPKPAFNFISYPIFDESEQQTYFFHRWANFLHIKTKEITLKNESVFFTQKCRFSADDLAQLERHLRDKKYIHKAKVSMNKDKSRVDIEVWDNWSLLPSIDLGRKGGENRYAIGIKDRNLLGLGIDAEIKSFSNSQRSGFKFDGHVPLFLQNHSQASYRIADNDDGEQFSLFLSKPFVSLSSDTAYEIGFNDEEREDTVFQNGEDDTVFRHDITYKTASFGWLTSKTPAYALRYKLGVTLDEHDFSQVQDPDDHIPVNELPRDRYFLYPWLGLEYIENDYHKLKNLQLISQHEDVNLGWQFDTRLGLTSASDKNSADFLWQAEINKGYRLFKNSHLLLAAKHEGHHGDSGTRLLTEVSGELFHLLSERWTLYFKNINKFSRKQYLDQPVALGGGKGLRGYPLQYQHGKESLLFTAELRYYPNINLYRLFDLAGAVFIDHGKTSGTTPRANIEAGWLQSVGLGLRLFTPHARRDRQVLHLDLAYPLTDNPEIDGWEIRLESKRAF